MIKKRNVRVGCASGFWGDTSTAAKQLVEKGDLDYLVFDFLSEITMSILARSKIKDPSMGYAPDFVTQLTPLLGKIKENNIKVVSNAGGINPKSCRAILVQIANEMNVDLNIATVTGDDLITKFDQLKEGNICEIESNLPLPKSCLSINAYLGATPIVKAFENDADIVITGRCVDSALVLAPLMYEFGWKDDEYNLLASGSLAGHIIECGAQCTGGNFTDWKQVKGYDNMGFPIVEVKEDGDFIVTKPNDTGGMVTFGTVAEQLLYEIADPGAYLLPDVTCDFTKVSLREIGKDQVLVRGASGRAPTNNYKVSATYMNGYRVAGTLVIGGKDAKEKGTIIAKAIINKVSQILIENDLEPFNKVSYDLLGTDSIYGPKNSYNDSKEIVLRLIATHTKKSALTFLSREMAQAVTGMPAGVINYLGGRPPVSPSIHLFSFLIPKDQANIYMNLNEQTELVHMRAPSNVIEKASTPRTKSRLVVNPAPKYVVPLYKLAYARSGDKGDNANIGVIAREPEFLPYIQEALSSENVATFFSHCLTGEVISWDVPGINGINFLLKNSLGGGGMSSLSIDPQGKSYAQQILEYEIPVDKNLIYQFGLQSNGA